MEAEKGQSKNILQIRKILRIGIFLETGAAIERMWIKKKHFAMKSLTGWKRNGDNDGSNKPQLHLEELDVSLRVKKLKIGGVVSKRRRAG